MQSVYQIREIGIFSLAGGSKIGQPGGSHRAYRTTMMLSMYALSAQSAGQSARSLAAACGRHNLAAHQGGAMEVLAKSARDFKLSRPAIRPAPDHPTDIAPLPLLQEMCQSL